MKKSTLLLLCLVLTLPITAQQAKINVKEQFEYAQRQYEGMLKSHPDLTKFPQSTLPDGSPRDMKSDWWCSGFFGASLWYIYEYTKGDKWKEAAHQWTMAVEKEQLNTRTHDLGFMIYCPFGNGYRLTGNEAYKNIMLTGAKSLATRFDPKRGVIKSWDKFQNYSYPVIVDNMMNLEFLFWASKTSGDKSFYNISTTHADATMKHHYRPDFSSYHVVCYNADGTVEAKKTHQGFADESAWARGQAWGMYGYITMYRETKDKKYLNFAVKIADFFINHPNLPADKIPYWDFNAKDIPNDVRDASAAAIVASGLLELQGYVKGKKRKKYFQTAEAMLTSLSSPAYRAKIGENNNFMLMHCTGHKPGKSEIDVPLVYADYYFLEALLRYDALTN
jgi:unsaturated chondroitin disaccharide hydrolase